MTVPTPEVPAEVVMARLATFMRMKESAVAALELYRHSDLTNEQLSMQVLLAMMNAGVSFYLDAPPEAPGVEAVT